MFRKLEEDYKECINCKACYKVCPMMDRFSETPKDMLEELIQGELSKSEVAFSCMLCGGCSKVCPKNIDLKDTFSDMRKKLYTEKKINKKYNLKIVKNHQSLSFSKVTTTNSIKKGSKRLFIPGCSLSGYSSEIVLKTFKYLNDNLEDIDILIKCCGKPSKDIGDINSFNTNIENLNQVIKENNIEEVIVACENCYITFKENLKVNKVITLWEVLREIGIPKELKGNYKEYEEFALHDPCPIKDEKQIHESVRVILNELGVNIVEFKNNRDKTICCGSGGMVGVTNRELFLVQKNKRANETDCKNIVSYCQSCVNTLKSNEKNTLHILDFIFNDEVINHKRINSEKISTLKSWSNRIKLKRKVLR